MEKGRFYKISSNTLDDYYFVLNGVGKRLYLRNRWPAENSPKDWINNINYDSACEITDFCNDICFEILKSRGIEYRKESDTIENVIYLWDTNLIPGEKFIGVSILNLFGTEKSWYDLLPNIEMGLDILKEFRFDLDGYIGLRRSYRLYLPYDETSLELYKTYIEVEIEKRFEIHKDLERKIRI